MKLCAAQINPVKGDVSANLVRHRQFIERATTHGADFIIFPELSLTGYEPTLARALAIDLGDGRLDDLQALSDRHRITLGIGAPTRHEGGVCISLILLQPHQPRRTYSKNYLHADEEPFFVRGHNSPALQIGQTRIALAICYEISVAEHLALALETQPHVYIASVAKFARGIEKSLDRLSALARDHSLLVLMSNCVGLADGHPCAGHTSIWNHDGSLLAQLNDTEEALLLLDTTNGTATKITLT